jgi:hypothetical protein
MPDLNQIETVETVIARAGIVHMDNFAVIATIEPATAPWGHYSPLEQGKARLAAVAVVAALDAAGYAIVREAPLEVLKAIIDAAEEPSP